MNNTIDKKLINYGEALYEACFQEMANDENVFVYGLGVDDPKGHYGTSKDLHKIYGNKRNFDVPLSEDGLTGIGIGAALAGLRPIYVHQRMDFLLLCMNQLVNMAAKLRYISSGEHSVPGPVQWGACGCSADAELGPQPCRADQDPGSRRLLRWGDLPSCDRWFHGANGRSDRNGAGRKRASGPGRGI